MTIGKAKASEIVGSETLAITCILALIGFGIVETKDHRSFSVAEDAKRLSQVAPR